MKRKRDSLNKEGILEKSKKIIENLTSLEQFQFSKNIMFYVSSDSEVFTHEIIKKLIDEKNIFVPLIKNNQIQASSLNSFSELEKGKFNILEPKIQRLTDPKELDAVIVPGLAFDNNGNRIGYGLGFYDKFLKKTNALKIGLAFDLQIVDKIMVKDFDVKMDIVVTENRVI